MDVDSDKLITAMQMQPALWDKTDPDYSIKVKKDNAWKEVFQFIFCEEESEHWDREKKNDAAKTLQKRWKHLRNSFAREVAKRKHPKIGSGRDWKTYVYFDQMSFLLPSMNHAQVESNIGEEGEAEETEDSFCERVYVEGSPQPSTSNAASKKRKRGQTLGENYLAEVLAKNLKWRQEKDEAQDNDPDRLFILSLLNEFKRVPVEYKANVKMELIRVINDGIYTHPGHTHPGYTHPGYTHHYRYEHQPPAPYYVVPSSSRMIPKYTTDSRPLSVPLSESSDNSYHDLY